MSKSASQSAAPVSGLVPALHRPFWDLCGAGRKRERCPLSTRIAEGIDKNQELLVTPLDHQQSPKSLKICFK